MKRLSSILALIFASIVLVTVTTACTHTVQTTLPGSFAAGSWNPLNDSEKTPAWAEQLLGEVLTFKAMADNGAIRGNFQPYVDVMARAREAYRAGDRTTTYDAVNQFMIMLEARVGDLDPHAADTLWTTCYRWTPDEYHARERHVRAVGQDELNKWEDFLRHQEEKASISF